MTEEKGYNWNTVGLKQHRALPAIQALQVKAKFYQFQTQNTLKKQGKKHLSSFNLK